MGRTTCTAVDKHGRSVGSLLCAGREMNAARKFFRNAVAKNGFHPPRCIEPLPMIAGSPAIASGSLIESPSRIRVKANASREQARQGRRFESTMRASSRDPRRIALDRRMLLTSAAALPLIGCAASTLVLAPTDRSFRRVRPGDPGWPSDAQWEALNRTVGCVL